MVFDKIAMQVPKILLPRKGVDLQRWAVIACDQYTSDEDYWKKYKGTNIKYFQDKVSGSFFTWTWNARIQI